MEKCAICTSDIKIQRLLMPCKHSICNSCHLRLERVLKEDSIPCPICGEEFSGNQVNRQLLVDRSSTVVIFIRSPFNNDTWMGRFSKEDKVSAIKEYVTNRSGFNGEMRVLFDARSWESDRLLSEMRIQNEQTVHVIGTLRGD